MTAVEVRSYEGDGSDLAELTNRSWRATVAGKAMFPLWSQSYFQWRLLADGAGDRDFLVAAYQGSKLVGCILGEPMPFRVGDRSVQGTLSSWLTVDPDSQSPRLALRMLAEFRKRHQERDMSFSMGFSDSVSRRFWEALAKRPPHDVHSLGEIALWSRILDARAVGAAGMSSFQRHGPALAQYIPALRPRPSAPVRAYRSGDLGRCREWLVAQATGADIRLVWPAARLERQLEHPYATTLVLDRGARGGFINYYVINMLGAAELRVAVIDLFAGNLGIGQQAALLGAACDRMREQGVHMTIMMKSEAAPWRALAAGGFIPYAANVEYFWYFVDPSLRVTPPVRHHILFG